MHGDWRVEQFWRRNAGNGRNQELAQDSFRPQDYNPRIRANQEICPEGDNHEQQQDVAPTILISRNVICEGIAQDQADNGRNRSRQDRPPQDAQIERIQQPSIIFWRKRPVNAAVCAALGKTVDENGRDREKKEEDKPKQGGKKKDENTVIGMVADESTKLIPCFHGGILDNADQTTNQSTEQSPS